jgi:hypothetical protein
VKNSSVRTGNGVVHNASQLKELLVVLVCQKRVHHVMRKVRKVVQNLWNFLGSSERANGLTLSLAELRDPELKQPTVAASVV